MNLKQGNGETILMDDDEIILTRVIATILNKNGYKVLMANEGAGALALYRERSEEISVVLTDVMMPGMDGVALARELNGFNPKVKIIVSSGYSTESHQIELRALGVPAILKKPYDISQLLTALQREIQRETG